VDDDENEKKQQKNLIASLIRMVFLSVLFIVSVGVYFKNPIKYY
jgi:hypothetical protein